MSWSRRSGACALFQGLHRKPLEEAASPALPNPNSPKRLRHGGRGHRRGVDCTRAVHARRVKLDLDPAGLSLVEGVVGRDRVRQRLALRQDFGGVNGSRAHQIKE